MAARVTAALIIVALTIGATLYFKPWEESENDSSLITRSPHGDKSAAGSGIAKFDLSEAKNEKPISQEKVREYIKNVPNIIAEISGDPVANDEYVRALNGMLNNIAKGGRAVPEAVFTEMRANLLTNILDTETLSRKADSEGVEIDEGKVTETYEQIKSRYPTEEAFLQAMTENGSNEEKIKVDIARSLKVQALIEQEIVSSIIISEESARKYYDENISQFEREESVSASHILVAARASDSEEKKAEAKKKAEGILKRLHEGADFAELAKTMSDDPGAARQGGDLGFFGRGKMVPEFEAVAFALKPGDISDIVKTQFGYHIILVTGRRDAGLLPFDEVKDKLADQLKRAETGKRIKQYIEDLKKEMNVKTFIS